METDYQQEVLDEVEEHEQVEEGTREQLIVFKLGQEEYALPIDQIKEIVLTPRISAMPQTPDYVKGIANIRGNVISILDFEEKFGLHGASKKIADNDGTNYTLVIESEEYQVGVLVREVPNTLSVLSSKIDSSANIMQHSTLDESVIKGIVKEKDRMIILIDVLLMMQIGELKTKL